MEEAGDIRNASMPKVRPRPNGQGRSNVVEINGSSKQIPSKRNPDHNPDPNLIPWERMTTFLSERK